MNLVSLIIRTIEQLAPKKFDGVARLFNRFLENKDLPQDSVLERAKNIRDKLVMRNYTFSEAELRMIPMIGLMIILMAQALIEDSPEGKGKEALIADLVEFEGFMKLSSDVDKDNDKEMIIAF